MRSSDLWKNVILAVLVTILALEVASWFAIRVLASRGFIYVAGQIEESARRDTRVDTSAVNQPLLARRIEFHPLWPCPTMSHH